MSSVLSPAVQEAFALVLEPLHGVKDSLLAVIPPDSEVLAETVQTSLTGGGKYLRPVVTLLAGAATRKLETEAARLADIRQKNVEVAAVAEMIHVATLLHDDVIDQSELRRGQPTVRSRWGNKVSILSGDYLLAQASLKLSRLESNRLVAIYSHVLADLCDGEVEQMQTSFNLSISWDSYYKKTVCKTASLFSAGCEAAGVVNNLPEPQVQALKTYGRNFGIAFQIMDDLLDYTATEAELGKPVLDDLRNGLLTAPILLALDADGLDPGKRAQLRADVQALFENPQDESMIARIRQWLAQGEAVEKTRALAHRYIAEARECLGFVAPSAEKQALLDLVDYVAERRS